jgi:hypothetical protein
MKAASDPAVLAELARLEKLPSAELVAEYRRLFGEEPRCRHRVWLFRNCAWRVQELAYGGLSQAAQGRLAQLMAEVRIPGIDGPALAAPVRPPDPTAPPVGTVLEREWRGQRIRVTATAAGYDLDGRTFRSLSAIAQHVTGTKWNGRAWFGLAPASTRR